MSEAAEAEGRGGPATSRGLGGPVALPVLLLAPLAGLILLLSRPDLDFRWEHHPSHFWLVLTGAVINVGLGLLTSDAATRRADARLFLVSLALLASAGFLGLHALATPGVLLPGVNTGFALATPMGLLFAAGFAAASALHIDEARGAAVLRRQRRLRGGLVAVLGAWAAVSLAGLPPLDEPLAAEDLPLVLRVLAAPTLALYAFAAIRYARLYRRRPRTLLVAVVAAYVLLAEAMIAVAFGRSWHATWWEWHVLMAIAFGTIAAGARIEYLRDRSPAGAFGGLYLESTLDRIDRRHADALAEMVQALASERPLAPILQRIHRDWANAEELALLEQAARQLRRVDELFRPYVAPQLAKGLQERPELARLGGEEREVSVLFADLAGFTAFSERRRPDEVIGMLNAYWGAAVPVVAEREGGVIERFAGDAIMVVFNAVGDQPDHPLRAARAALELRDEAQRIAAGRDDWPRFRIGVNSGPAVIGNVGARSQRSFTAIGDTTNLAARLQTAAEPGQVVLGQTTWETIRDRAEAEPLGPLRLKGKSEPVEAFTLVSLSG
jgi:adenylate cyclase